jgi:hypothetical protein
MEEGKEDNISVWKVNKIGRKEGGYKKNIEDDYERVERREGSRI